MAPACDQIIGRIPKRPGHDSKKARYEAPEAAEASEDVQDAIRADQQSSGIGLDHEAVRQGHILAKRHRLSKCGTLKGSESKRLFPPWFVPEYK